MKTEYKNLITEMVNKIEDEKFLRQIYTIVRRHIMKKGD